MRLTDEEQAMLAGAAGEPRRWAMQHQIAIGEFFEAADLVPVSQAHIMADTESLGEAGIRFLESLAAAPGTERRVRVPTLTDPRGLDFQTYKSLGQTDAMAALETWFLLRRDAVAQTHAMPESGIAPRVSELR